MVVERFMLSFQLIGTQAIVTGTDTAVKITTQHSFSFLYPTSFFSVSILQYVWLLILSSVSGEKYFSTVIPCDEDHDTSVCVLHRLAFISIFSKALFQQQWVGVHCGDLKWCTRGYISVCVPVWQHNNLYRSRISNTAMFYSTSFREETLTTHIFWYRGRGIEGRELSAEISPLHDSSHFRDVLLCCSSITVEWVKPDSCSTWLNIVSYTENSKSTVSQFVTSRYVVSL